ncbi:uncharacterized protein LOC129275967, partial [Lytechinus pictus]|uniref:uncharacterized protein LOC129275967 n=1 Tax=Lytechinus pictus TaxID=7653 RepID=UPI0030B9F106
LAASTVPIINSTSLSLNLTVPREHLYSKQALLVWRWHHHKAPPTIQVTNYFITYQQEGSNSKTVITVDSAFTSETLRTLKPNEPYRAFIKAVLNSTDVPFVDSALTYFHTPEQRFKRSDMGVTEFIILFLIFALWGLAMLRFFGTWNKKMNLRVTKDSIRTRDSSPTHRHLEAYRLYKKRRSAQQAKQSREREQGEAGSSGGGFGRSWQRSSTMKSFRARASNFSKRTRFGSSKSSAPPSPLPTTPECEPLRAEEQLTAPHPILQLQKPHHEQHEHRLHHHQPHQHTKDQPVNVTPPLSQPHAAAAAAAAVVIGVPVHVSYEAAGGSGDGSPTATVRLSPDRNPHSVI